MSKLKLILLSSGGAFITYFSMYAFRKPFTAALFTDITYFGIDYKILLVTLQLIGYATAKVLGIKIISELKKDRRPFLILILVGISWLSLLLFSIIPPPYNALLMLLNGLPLGFIWGIVFSYLEGRKITELLAAGLSISFIVSSGAVKTIGRWFIDAGLSEFWMPTITGLIFFPSLGLGVWMLTKIPEPTKEDKSERVERKEMSKITRLGFVKDYKAGLIATAIIYLSLTVFRDIRDNFAVDIWKGLGFLSKPEILTTSETFIAVAVLIIAGSLFLIKSNWSALNINLILLPTCAFLMITSLILFKNGIIGPVSWMIVLGFSMYLPYITYHTMLLERWIAAFKVEGNVGFLMYIMDSVGYVATLVILIVKNYISPEMSWGNFFIQISWVTAAVMIVFGIISFIYFSEKNRRIKILNTKMYETGI